MWTNYIRNTGLVGKAELVMNAATSRIARSESRLCEGPADFNAHRTSDLKHSLESDSDAKESFKSQRDSATPDAKSSLQMHDAE